jgi:hypothetical protein
VTGWDGFQTSALALIDRGYCLKTGPFWTLFIAPPPTCVLALITLWNGMLVLSMFDSEMVLGLDVAEDVSDDGTDAGAHEAGDDDGCEDHGRLLLPTAAPAVPRVAG